MQFCKGCVSFGCRSSGEVPDKIDSSLIAVPLLCDPVTGLIPSADFEQFRFHWPQMIALLRFFTCMKPNDDDGIAGPNIFGAPVCPATDGEGSS